MADPIRSKLDELLNEVSPEDFGAGSEADLIRQREEQVLDTVGGAGTRDRAGARRWITTKLKNLLTVNEDHERDEGFLLEYMNLLNWAHSVYGDLEGYHQVIRLMERMIKDYKEGN